MLLLFLGAAVTAASVSDDTDLCAAINQMVLKLKKQHKKMY